MPKLAESYRPSLPRSRNFVLAWSLAVLWNCVAPLVGSVGSVGAARGAEGDQAADDGASGGRIGYVLDVPLPIRGEAADQFLQRLEGLSESIDAGSRRRTTVVLRFGSDSDTVAEAAEGSTAAEHNGRGSTFEDSVALARFLSGTRSRLLKTVAYLTGPVEGHAVLVVLACDEFAVAPGASLGNATADEAEVDEALQSFYQSVAAGRGLVPEVAVRAMVDPSTELFHVTEVDGTERFVDSQGVAELRAAGGTWKEDRLADAMRRAIFSADQLREFRWASHTATDIGELTRRLGVSKLVEPSREMVGQLTAARVEIQGPINGARVRRFQSNIAGALESGHTNSLLISIDSPGGDLESSLQLGLTLSRLDSGRGVSIGYVEEAARGDAALLAVACKPLYMHPEARLGGSGAEAIGGAAVAELREALEALAKQAGRPSSLVIGLIDPAMNVYRYTHRQSGQVGYFTEESLPSDQPGVWQRGERIDLAEGLSASEAVQLGLAEGEADSLALAANRAGLESVPPPLRDRGVVRTVEWLGGLPFLAGLLVFIGFMALSMEMSAPGLGLPGFISLICFLLFFWMKFLSGTAEWLEVILFAGGIVCILIEVLVVPGLGVFGVGGMLMVVAAIVLTSQTFVIPQNDYQFQQTTRGLMSVVAALAGILGGLVALRFLLPGTPLFRHLVMPGPTSDEMIEQEQREHLVRYEWLQGRQGVAVTPLRPAGKARFDDQVVAVVSDGSPLSPGDAVRVIQVQGNRVVVEPV